MFKNILLFCFVCILIFFGFELTLRIVETIHSGKNGASLKIGEFHPVLGWKLNNKIIKGSRIYRSEDGRTVDFYVNSDGYRGDEFGPIDAKAKRVLILGDSFAQADQIRLEERLSERLQMALNGSSSIKYKVLNMGVSGYSTDQEYLTYLEMGKKYQPHITLLLFHDNDVWMNNKDIFLDVQKPRLEYRGDRLVMAHHPDKNWAPPTGEAPSVSLPKKDILTRLKEYLSGHSRVYSWIRKKIRESSVLMNWCAQLGFSGAGLVDVPDDFRAWSVRPDEEVEAAWDLTSVILDKLRQLILKDGGLLIVVYVPPRPAVYPEHWLATKIRYGFNDNDWDIYQVPKRLKKICEKLSVQMIDPSEHLIRAVREARNGERIYFAMDSHWTRKAHAIVADVILKEAADALN